MTHRTMFLALLVLFCKVFADCQEWLDASGTQIA
jgi:hypothetical protein